MDGLLRSVEMSTQQSDRRAEYVGMFLILVVMGCIYWYFRLPQHQLQSSAPTEQERPGDVLKGVTIAVDHNESDEQQRIRISQNKMPEALKQQQLIRDCLTKNREHLPSKYYAGLLWTESELILVIVPTKEPITMEQVHAFVEIIWALEKNLGDHQKRRDVVISSQGPLKGGHGVALPLKKPEVPAKKPAA
jgi:hypothetical protein